MPFFNFLGRARSTCQLTFLSGSKAGLKPVNALAIFKMCNFIYIYYSACKHGELINLSGCGFAFPENMEPSEEPETVPFPAFTEQQTELDLDDEDMKELMMYAEHRRAYQQSKELAHERFEVLTAASSQSVTDDSSQDREEASSQALTEESIKELTTEPVQRDPVQEAFQEPKQVLKKKPSVPVVAETRTSILRRRLHGTVSCNDLRGASKTTSPTTRPTSRTITAARRPPPSQLAPLRFGTSPIQTSPRHKHGRCSIHQSHAAQSADSPNNSSYATPQASPCEESSVKSYTTAAEELDTTPVEASGKRYQTQLPKITGAGPKSISAAKPLAPKLALKFSTAKATVSPKAQTSRSPATPAPVEGSRIPRRSTITRDCEDAVAVAVLASSSQTSHEQTSVESASAVQRRISINEIKKATLRRSSSSTQASSQLTTLHTKITCSPTFLRANAPEFVPSRLPMARQITPMHWQLDDLRTSTESASGLMARDAVAQPNHSDDIESIQYNHGKRSKAIDVSIKGKGKAIAPPSNATGEDTVTPKASGSYYISSANKENHHTPLAHPKTYNQAYGGYRKRPYNEPGPILADLEGFSSPESVSSFHYKPNSLSPISPPTDSFYDNYAGPSRPSNNKARHCGHVHINVAAEHLGGYCHKCMPDDHMRHLH